MDVRKVDFLTQKQYIESMAKQGKKPVKAVSKRRLDEFDRPFMYHGIKILPMLGKRSATAEAIRDALREQSEQKRGKRAPA